MIEKITNQNQIARRKLAEKINEIVDLLNAIVVDVDGTKCIDGSKSPAENLKLWQELIRTRKALDVAVDALKEIDKTRSVANHKIGTQDKTLKSGIVFCWATPDEIHNALAEIIALEQKESAFVHNKIEFPEFNDGLLEEFDKQFFENGQDDI